MAAVSIIYLDQSPCVACQAVKTRANVVARVRMSSYLFGHSDMKSGLDRHLICPEKPEIVLPSPPPEGEFLSFTFHKTFKIISCSRRWRPFGSRLLNIHDANFTFSEGKEAFSKRLVERRASTEW